MLVAGMILSSAAYGYVCGATMVNDYEGEPPVWWGALIGGVVGLAVGAPLAWLSLKLERRPKMVEPEPEDNSPDSDWGGDFVQTNADGSIQQIKFVNPLDTEDLQEEEDITGASVAVNNNTMTATMSTDGLE